MHYQGTVSTGHRKSDLRPSSLGPFWRIFDLTKYTNVKRREYVKNMHNPVPVKLYTGFYPEIRSGNQYVAVAAENARRTGAFGVSDTSKPSSVSRRKT